MVECLWALYRINEMMDLLSDNPKTGTYHHFWGTLSLRQI
jgi:hypothetical protein